MLATLGRPSSFPMQCFDSNIYLLYFAPFDLASHFQVHDPIVVRSNIVYRAWYLCLWNVCATHKLCLLDTVLALFLRIFNPLLTRTIYHYVEPEFLNCKKKKHSVDSIIKFSLLPGWSTPRFLQKKLHTMNMACLRTSTNP